ncbi:MAG: SPOR domain-containing protein [Sulfurimicrobium sp.]
MGERIRPYDTGVARMIVFARWMFTLLLIANIALFAAMLLPRDQAGSDTLASHAPFRAEKIRLITEDEMPPPAPAPVAQQVCLEWGQFAEQDLARARTALQALKLDAGDISVQDVPAARANSWWVYIPPLKSKQDANRKVGELKGLGVQDSFVMQDDNPWRYAVSLGVFSTQEAADRYLAQVRAKGVKSAKAAPRNQDGSHSSMVIKASGADIEAELVKLKQDFPATELKAVPCAQ